MKTGMSGALAPDYEEPPLVDEGCSSGTSMRRQPARLKDRSYAVVVQFVFLETPARTSRSYERIKSCMCQATLLQSSQTDTSSNEVGCLEPFGLFLFAISAVVPL